MMIYDGFPIKALGNDVESLGVDFSPLPASFPHVSSGNLVLEGGFLTGASGNDRLVVALPVHVVDRNQ